MIRTRFGSEVQIIRASRQRGTCDVRRVPDGKIFREVRLADLRADRGHIEIDTAITKAARAIAGRDAGLRPL
jgi:hypothetical protein